MSWVFVIKLRAPDGTEEQREFVVHDERLATILQRILFDKTATQEEIHAFALEEANDPELRREWLAVKDYLKPGWTIQ